MFVVNFVLSFFATIPLATRLARVADHSLYSDRLYHGFDLFAFIELAGNPEVSLWSKFSGSILFSVVFFVFILFLIGGILETYRTDRKLPAGAFFEACGTYFWRWVRLLVWFLIVLVPIGILASVITKWAGKLTSDAPQERLGFWVDVIGLGFVLFLSLAVRLWFDMTQVRAVAEDERAMRRTLARTLRVIWSNFGSLFWMYFRITLLAWAGLALAIFLWTRILADRVGLSFLVLEVALLWWMGTRLWQRASETVWYEQWTAVQPRPESILPIAEPLVTAPATPPSQA